MEGGDFRGKGFNRREMMILMKAKPASGEKDGSIWSCVMSPF